MLVHTGTNSQLTKEIKNDIQHHNDNLAWNNPWRVVWDGGVGWNRLKHSHGTTTPPAVTKRLNALGLHGQCFGY